MDRFDHLLELDNIYIAYLRARRAVVDFEGLADLLELSSWEANLDHHLDLVRQLLQDLDHPIPCRLVPIPKAAGEVRAYYSIPLIYQVGWAAIVQALGPLLDKRMPSWSFGYRLHRPRMRFPEGTPWLWDEHLLGASNLYLGFTRSWKPFRRYANLTVKRMLGDKKPDDPREEEVLDYERAKASIVGDSWESVPRPRESPDADLRHAPFPYLISTWRTTRTRRIWYARLDLRKFFPMVKCKLLHRRLLSELSHLPGFSRSKWSGLLRRWLTFAESVNGVDTEAQQHLARERVGSGGLPVGLIASGFLSNVFMLPVDRELEDALQGDYHGDVALFRYVDDYIVLSDRRERLCRWLALQFAVLSKSGLEMNLDKLKPSPLKQIAEQFAGDVGAFQKWLAAGGHVAALPNPLEDSKTLGERWRQEGSITRLDRKEFVSTTLQRMSHRADEEVALLDEAELDARILDLTDLAAAEEDRHEIRVDTLEAFAAAQLERTPLSSPGPTLELAQLQRDRDALLKERETPARPGTEEPLGRVEAQIESMAEQVVTRISSRSEHVFLQVLGSFVGNPHKHRLLDRLIRIGAAAAEFSNETFLFRAEMESLSLLLSGSESPPVEEFRWMLATSIPSLQPALRTFLRMRAWSALAECLEETMRGALRLRLPAEDKWGTLPSFSARLQRRMTWLTAVGHELERTSGGARRAAGSSRLFTSSLEVSARHWWRLWRGFVRPTPRSWRGIFRRDHSRYLLNVRFAHRALLPWAKAGGSGSRFELAVKAVTAVADQIGTTGSLSDIEGRLVRDWVRGAEASLMAGDIARPLLNWSRSASKYHHDSQTVGWVSDVAWRSAPLPELRRQLGGVATAAPKEFREFIRAVAKQGAAASRGHGAMSLRGLLESTRWPKRGVDKYQPASELPEAARVALIRGVLEVAERSLETPDQLWLAPDNLFVERRNWEKVLDAVGKGRRPTAPPLEYRPLLRDPLFAVPERLWRSEDDVLVAAGLCGVSLAAGQSTLDKMSRVGSRARLLLNSVWQAIEGGPAISHVLVQGLASLCAVGHLRQMSERMLMQCAALYGTPTEVPEARVLISDVQGRLARLATQLAHDSTRLKERTLYVLASGLHPPEPPSASFGASQDPLAETLDVTLVQVDLEIDNVWSFDGTLTAYLDDFVWYEAWPRIWQALRAARRGPPSGSGAGQSRRPRLVVFPELSVPRRFAAVLRRFAQTEQAVVVAGAEYRSTPGWVRNEALVAIPAPERHPASLARAFWVAKHHPSLEEWRALALKGIRFTGPVDFTMFEHKQVGRLGVAICYDLYAVETLAAFQRHVLHLVIPAYNRDLGTFDGLGESAMRLLFANVILANTGRFGGSLAVAPLYNPWEREMLRVRGQHIDTVERVAVPLASLDREQRASKWPLRDARPRRFKGKPADW